MKKAYLSFFALVTFLEDAIASVTLMIATILTVAQIINRYWLRIEIMWIADLSLYIFIIGAIFSVAITTRMESHVGVDLFLELLGKREKTLKFTKIVINLVSLTILIMVLPLFYAFFLRSLRFAEWGTLVRWFNTSWLVQCVFVMFVLNIFHVIHNTVIHIIEFYRLCVGGTKECPSD